ncbi:MAG: YebC/PmpR family DNA-binding transcriptional regulator [bacterium]|nr:YebC/PmpR family DNA-binding transcriptional regulator [Planctomycetota bacterium]HIL53239.1 YebC/PmpR family DNA-binding transcriptional regulator [Planctomycetota bacterium]
MAGHSHSANIKHRKNAVDAKRGKLFSKLAKIIMSAARQGGGDIDANPKLRLAIEKAKAANMTKDSIERAVKKGSGELGDGVEFEELIYEGYGPCGVAVMVVCLTDNRKRTAPEIKHTFEKRGGNLGSPGSVAFMFDFRSIFVVENGERDEEQMMELALEAGADDVEVDDGLSTIFAEATDFLDAKLTLDGAGVKMLSGETGYVAQTTTKIESLDDARKILKLLEALEENEDVQNVYANYDIPDEWLEELS